MNLGQLKTLVRDLIRDNVNYEATAPDSQSALNYTETQVTDAINWAIKNYCDKTGASYLEENATLTADGIATIPSDFIRILGVEYSNKELVESTADFEDLKDDEWESRTGTVTRRWVKWSGSQVKLTPILAAWSGGTSQCAIKFIEQPTALALNADNVDSRIPASQQEYLKYAAAAWLLQMMNDEQNYALANQFDKQFNALIKGVR